MIALYDFDILESSQNVDSKVMFVNTKRLVDEPCARCDGMVDVSCEKEAVGFLVVREYGSKGIGRL